MHLDLAQKQNGLQHVGDALQKIGTRRPGTEVRRSATDQPLDLRDLHESSTRRSSLTRHVLCRSVEVGWSGVYSAQSLFAQLCWTRRDCCCKTNQDHHSPRPSPCLESNTGEAPSVRHLFV
ncbi:unnamed protein product [Clonostachys byssicola]|uniref:Uncharacterized protein n=1 Tax=Clonostachys byssicola TaxID=160290 RepID=A0A9N9UK60_9HYPO|nr:unnamed protein product [Clonostachys byssicola]